jgi:hypothetical protein
METLDALQCILHSADDHSNPLFSAGSLAISRNRVNKDYQLGFIFGSSKGSGNNHKQSVDAAERGHK